MKYVSTFTFIGLLCMTSGCATTNTNMPLIFGQSHNVGISISGTTVEQGVDFTLGYKDKDIAIVPVTVRQSNNNSTRITAKAPEKKAGNRYHEDALSVLGQFELNTDTKQADVGLGKFFATGLAAKKLADGFFHKLKQEVPKKEQSKTDADK